MAPGVTLHTYCAPSLQYFYLLIFYDTLGIQIFIYKYPMLETSVFWRYNSGNL